MKIHKNWQLQAVTRLAKHFGHDWPSYLTDPIAHRALRSPETWDAWNMLADRGCLGHEVCPDGVTSPWREGRLQHTTSTGRYGWQAVSRAAEQLNLTIHRPDGPVIEVVVASDFCSHELWSVDWYLFSDQPYAGRMPVFYDMQKNGGCLINTPSECRQYEARHVEYMQELIAVALPELDVMVPAVVQLQRVSQQMPCSAV